MTFWDVVATIATVTGDVFVVLAAVGTLGMAVVHGVNVAARRRVLSVPDELLHWAGSGLGMGILCLIGLLLSSEPIPAQIGFLIQMNIAIVVALCAASVAMFMMAVVLRRRVPSGRRRYAR